MSPNFGHKKMHFSGLVQVSSWHTMCSSRGKKASPEGRNLILQKGIQEESHPEHLRLEQKWKHNDNYSDYNIITDLINKLPKL